ncbi:hypothetical protein Metbo_1037 [Methanobacterium lacus]|uniref:Uncharacterized protein n=2 Tax=Methanobacterium lacus (strain AL-21) TaxID=877455 RepID=F0TCK7_METLA|nr:hypothetical protein Metbo_1037 [Methanobacterium lacus]
MNLKNSKNLLIMVIALFVIAASFITYFVHDYSIYTDKTFTNFIDSSNDTNVIESIDIQNSVLTDYVNSLYNSQVDSIESKYNSGTISLEEKNKQLNAVLKNRDMTVHTINKIDTAKKDVFEGKINQSDILIRINSFSSFNSDLKTEINETLNGY